MEKKLYYEDEQDLEGQKNTAQIVDFGVSLSVTAAINCVYYASGCIRERKDLYRQRVKQLCNLAVKSASQMEMRMKSVMFVPVITEIVIELSIAKLFEE